MKEVEDGHERESQLIREVETGKLQQKETKRRLERCFCSGCGQRFDATATILGVPATKFNDSTDPHQGQHETLVSRLGQEKRHLEDEVARLITQAKQLNLDLGETKRNAVKEKTRFEKELDEIQMIKVELEARVKKGDERLQSMRSEKDRLAQERKEAISKVERIEMVSQVGVQPRS